VKCHCSKIMLTEGIAAIAIVFVLAAVAPAQYRSPSPREVVETYCRLDADGTQLVHGGWLRLARGFIPQEIHPGIVKVVHFKLDVIAEYSVGNAVIEGNGTARVKVTYSYIGEIDLGTLTFSPSKPAPVRVDEYYDLLLTGKHFDFNSNDEEALLNGPRGWKIVGFPRAPHVMIDIAVRHVGELRDKASSKATKQDANLTIAALNQLRPYAGR